MLMAYQKRVVRRQARMMLAFCYRLGGGSLWELPEVPTRRFQVYRASALVFGFGQLSQSGSFFGSPHGTAPFQKEA